MSAEILCIEVSDSDEEKPSTSETNDTLAEAASVSAKNAPTQQHTKSRRKDKLQPMESEYEIITLDDPVLKKKKLLNNKQQLMKKSAQNQSKKQKWKSVPRNTDSPAQKLNNACEELLNSTETEEILKSIAIERVRVNYLLASYSMPDINFSLGSALPTLLFQLNERVRQRNTRFAKKSTT